MFRRITDILRRRRRTDGRVFFLFLAVALTLVLFGIVLQHSAAPRHAVDETPPPSAIEPSTALPSGAAATASVKLTPSVDPAYAYAYELGGGVQVSLVSWNREQGKYEVISTLTPDDLGLSGATRPVTMAEDPNWDGLQVFAVRVTLGVGTDDVVLLSRNGDRIDLLRTIDKDGAVRPASFRLAATRSGDFRLDDLTGDGVQEVVVTSGTSQGTGGAATGSETRVFRWNGTMLAYDAQLSWAYAMSGDVFPSPPSPQSGANAPPAAGQ